MTHLAPLLSGLVWSSEPTCAVPVVPGPEQSAGLLILSFPLPFALALVGEGVDALVAAGVAVRVVDDDVVRGDGQVNPQLVAGQAALGLGRAGVTVLALLSGDLKTEHKGGIFGGV